MGYEDKSQWRSAVWWLVVSSAALRLIVASLLGPGNDEAYHYLFAIHPDWSYFDHPPMLALVESAGLTLVGFHASILALRLGSVVLFAGSTWLMFRLTARLHGPIAGWIAAFALNVSAYYGVAAATFVLPDAPLVFFWLLTLDRLLVALGEPECVAAWAWVGLAWGGAMLSKYQAVFLPAATLAYLVFEPAERRWLRRPGPYLAFALGLAVFAPVIFWNASHDWASLAFQAGRAMGGSPICPDRLALFLVGQAAYLLPWLWVPLVATLGRALVDRFICRGGNARGRLLLYQMVVPLVAFGSVALVKPVLPHWSLVGFLAGFPLLGHGWAQMRQTRPGRLGVRLSLLGTLTVTLTGLVVFHARTGFLQEGGEFGLGLVPVAHDPTLETYGWKQVGRELQRRGLLTPPGSFLFTDRWYSCAHLAMATDCRIPVACYNRNHAQNFAYWSDPRDWVGRDGVFVGINDCELVVRDMARWFHRFEPLGTIPIYRNGVQIRLIHLYRGIDQKAPFPFGNVRSSAPARPPTAALKVPQFDWIEPDALDKIRGVDTRQIKVHHGCAPRQLQGMKQAMGKHHRSFRPIGLGVELLEERFLLSSGVSAAKGSSAALAVEVDSAPIAVTAPEDEPPLSLAARLEAEHTGGGGSVPERAVAAGGLRTATEPAQASGPVSVILNGLGLSVDSVKSGLAPIAGSLGHLSASSDLGSSSADRRASVTAPYLDQSFLRRWEEPGTPRASLKGLLEPSTRALRANGGAFAPHHPADRLEPLSAPRGFDLITNAFPFARESLERAISRFLSRIEQFGPRSVRRGTFPPSWLPWVVLTVAAGAGNVARRRWRRKADDETVEVLNSWQRIGWHGLPGVPSPR
jgi:hypothetical protein